MRFVEKFAKAILIILLLITVFFGWKITGITEDSNPYMLAETHPARQSIMDIRENFTGTYDSILIVLHNPEEGVFNQETLDATFNLTQQSRNLMFSNQDDLDNFLSISSQFPANSKFLESVEIIRQRGFTQSDAPLIRSIYENRESLDLSSKQALFLKYLAERVDPIQELAGMSATENVFLVDGDMLKAAITVNNTNIDPNVAKKAIMNNELMNMGVVNGDGTVTMITIELGLLPDDSEGQIRAYRQVSDMVANYQTLHPQFKDEVYIAGVPVFFAEQKQIMNHDMEILFPATILVVFALFAIFFRNRYGVIIPLLNVIGCVIWTLGMMAIIGTPLDLITSVLPVFLVTICSSDAIHILVEYKHQLAKGEDLYEANRKTMRLMTQPVILTTVTTCITFWLSTFTNIINLRNFGIYMSFGMFVALIISLLMIPAMLFVFKFDKNHHKRSDGSAQETVKVTIIERILLYVSKKIEQHRIGLTVAFAFVLMGGVYLGYQIRVDDMGSRYFSSTNEFRQSDDFINSHIAGTSPGWIEIDSGTDGGAISIEMVNFIDKMEQFVNKQENVTFSYSIARYIRRINYTLNDFNPEYDRLPYQTEYITDYDEYDKPYQVTIDGNDIIRQSVLMYENGGGTDLTNVLSSDFSKTTLLYTMNTTLASEYQVFLEKLVPWLDENIPNGASYKLAGSPLIWTSVLNEMWGGQKLGIFISFFSIFAVMSLWLRSVRYGFFGTIPLMFTVIFYFAFMSVADIELNIGTAIISFLVLGVVDYSVHFIIRMRDAVNDGAEVSAAMHYAIMTAGNAITINIIIFFVGFTPLLLSSFKPIFDVGLLVGFSLFLSGILTIFSLSLFAPVIFYKKDNKLSQQKLITEITT